MSGFGEGLPYCRLLISSCTLTWWKKMELSLQPLKRALIPFMTSPPKYLPKAWPPNTITVANRFQHVNLEAIQYLVRNRSHKQTGVPALCQEWLYGMDARVNFTRESFPSVGKGMGPSIVAKLPLQQPVCTCDSGPNADCPPNPQHLETTPEKGIEGILNWQRLFLKQQQNRKSKEKLYGIIER